MIQILHYMEQNSLILVVNNLSPGEQTIEIFGQTYRKMFTARLAAGKADNVSSDTGWPFIFIWVQNNMVYLGYWHTTTNYVQVKG